MIESSIQYFLIALYSVCANILFPLPVNNLTYLQHGKEVWRRRRRRRREARRRTSARTRPSGRPPRPPPARPWPARHTPKRKWPLLLLLDAVMLLRLAKSTHGANLAFWKVTFQFCHKRQNFGKTLSSLEKIILKISCQSLKFPIHSVKPNIFTKITTFSIKNMF